MTRTPHDEERYNIVRFWSEEGRSSKVMQKGLTLKEAKEHCGRPDTRKEGVWFDGYTKS